MTRHSVDKKEAEREVYVQNLSSKRSYETEIAALKEENEKLKSQVKKLQNKIASYKDK